MTGKNASSAGFMMVIDQISLTATGGTGTGGSGGSTGRGGTTGGGGSTGSGGRGHGQRRRDRQQRAYEAEALTRTASSPPGSQVTSEAGASGGQYVQLSGTPAVNAWIEFTLPNVAAGTYDVKLLYKANTNRGIVQATIDGASQGRPATNTPRPPINRRRATWRARRWARATTRFASR